MSRPLRLTVWAGAATAVLLWTLAVLGAWGLLQAAAGALDGGTPAAATQLLTAWTERPWVRLWLDPLEVEALRDGLDWLFSLGGGPVGWLGTAMAWLAAALVAVWIGGLVLAALAAWALHATVLGLGAWWRQGPRWPGSPRAPVTGPPAPGA